MMRILFILITLTCLRSYAGDFTLSTSSGLITDLTIPWTKQGDTARIKVTIKNTSPVNHTVKLTLSKVSGAEDKLGSPLFFDVGGALHDSIGFTLNAGANREFTVIDIPALYTAGRFKRYLNVYKDGEFQPTITLDIIAGSALTLSKRNFIEDILVELRDLSAGVPEYLPVYFHNDSADAQVLTEFLGTTLPTWITVQNKYSYPTVVVPGESVNFANIIVAPPAPNMEELEGPVYLIYKNGSETRTTGISLYITSVTDTALLKPCVEFVGDDAFGPVKIGNSVTKTIQIKSNRPYPITVTQPKFSWGDVEGFSINTGNFPISLPAFGSADISITFAPNTVNPLVKYRYATGFTVHAEADTSSCDPVVALAGIAFTEGAVFGDANEMEITISPNPAFGNTVITVTGIENPTIEIADALGITHARVQADQFTANSLATGTYVVRCSGEDARGRMCVVSRILTVTR